MNSKRILLLTTEFPPQPGGIGNHASHLAQYLHINGYKLTVLTDQRSSMGVDEREFDQNLTFKVIRVKRYGFIWFTYLKRIYLAFRLIPETDTILFSGKFSLWLGGFLTLFASKKTIAILHGSEVASTGSTVQKLTRWCLRRFTKVVAVSEYTKSLVGDWGLDVAVIPNGFSIDIPFKPRPRSILPLQLITVGNVTQRKGQHNVVKALPAILKQYPNAKYHIVGIPTEKKQLQLLAKNLEVENHLVFHGKVSEADKIRLLQEATIFIMLSQATENGDVEGFGIAILEANAMGVPAVGAQACGIEDAISDGKSGRLVPFNDAPAIVNALMNILESYDSYAHEAKDWSQLFEWPAIIKTYIDLIES